MMGIKSWHSLPKPYEVKNRYPMSFTEQNDVKSWRRIVRSILQGEDLRLLLILGPCSVHSFEEILEYASRLKRLIPHLDRHFFVVMRVYLEKPRSLLGWKGLLYDPDLNGSYDLRKGLEYSRQLLLECTRLKIPVAMECLEPLVTSYFDDLITWGCVGARTSSSQIHRQMVSGLDFPFGFKNTIDGNIDVALKGIESAREMQSYFSLDNEGKLAHVKSFGNPYTHLIMRGGEDKGNYDAISLQGAKVELKKKRLCPRVLVDCSHGNSQKKYKAQKDIFRLVVFHSLKQESSILGAMLESYLEEGKQVLKDPCSLKYGISVTDSCLGWKDTEDLLSWSCGVLEKKYSLMQLASLGFPEKEETCALADSKVFFD